MSNRQFIEHARFSFAILRWSPLVAAVVLPFTLTHGLVPAISLGRAVMVAAAWLAVQMTAWKRRSQPWQAVGFMVFFFGSKWGAGHAPGEPLSLYLQWLCVVVALAGAPLLLFRPRLLRWARLDESCAA